MSAGEFSVQYFYNSASDYYCYGGPSCSDWVQARGPEQAGRRETFGPGGPKTSRPKPQPLWASPTDYPSSGGWYRFEVRGGVARTDYPCPDGCPGTYKYHYLSCLKAYPPYSTFPVVDYGVDLANKVKDLRVSLAGTLAELDETAKAVSNSASWLNEFARRARKCKTKVTCYRIKSKKRLTWTQAKGRPIKEVASKYLGMTFGIEPLIGVASDLIDKANSRLAEPTVHIVPFGGNAFRDDSGTDAYGQLVSGGARHTVRGKLYVQLDRTAGYITVGNPAEWLWERVPFSFVADWVLNVGDYLKSLDAYRGVSSTVGYASHRYHSEYSISQMGPAGTVDVSPASVIYSKWVRYAITAPPPSEFRLQYKPTKSVRALMNGLALLAVLRK